jgi:hypothetical protein
MIPCVDGFTYDLFYGGPAPRDSFYSSAGAGAAVAAEAPIVGEISPNPDFNAEYYPEFDPWENPDANSRPPFYDPAMAPPVQESWTDYLKRKGLQAAEKLVSLYVGRITDKFFDKFLLEVYPYALERAKQTGLPQLGFWFGDVMRVMPDGHWGLLYENVGDLDNDFKRYIEQLAKIDHFEVGYCPHGSEDLPEGTCWWVEYGSSARSLIAKAGGSWIFAFVLLSIWLGPKLLKGFK